LDAEFAVNPPLPSLKHLPPYVGNDPPVDASSFHEYANPPARMIVPAPATYVAVRQPLPGFGGGFFFGSARGTTVVVVVVVELSSDMILPNASTARGSRPAAPSATSLVEIQIDTGLSVPGLLASRSLSVTRYASAPSCCLRSTLPKISTCALS